MKEGNPHGIYCLKERRNKQKEGSDQMLAGMAE